MEVFIYSGARLYLYEIGLPSCIGVNVEEFFVNAGLQL